MMKKLFCACILCCLLLSSCASDQGDLNTYTTPADSETSFTVKTHDIPEELRVYVENYTYEPSDDSNDNSLYRNINTFAACNDYLYYSDQIIKNNKNLFVLKCLNTKTGEITSPCFDSVCSHDTVDCDFAFEQLIFIQPFGKYISIYGVKQVSQSNRAQGYLYDVTSGELRKEIFNKEKYGNISTYVCSSGNDLYNCGYKLYDNPNATGSDDKTVYEMQIWRYNIPSGKTETIHTLSDTYRGYSMSLVYQNRIYYNKFDKALGTGTMYSMSLNCDDVRKEPYFKTAKYYVGDTQWDVYEESGVRSVQSVNIKTGETKTIAESDKYELGLSVTDKYVYYSYIMPGAAGSEVSELWRCDHDGNNKTRLITFDGRLLNFSVYGNYIYRLTTVKQDGISSAKAMRIHVETGEVLIIE